MPIYSYECIYCFKNFEEINKFKGSGKTECVECGNIAFKIPSAPNLKIFKQREFGDGSKTPENVRTHSQEKKWMKSQGVSYEPAASDTKYQNEKKKKKQTQTVMEAAFHKAHGKIEQGYKGEENVT